MILPLVAVILSCSPPELPSLLGRQRSFTPVYLLGTERLEPPGVSTSAAVFKPAFMFALDENDHSLGQIAGFFVTLAASEARAVRFRLSDLETQAQAEFTTVAAPATEAERALAADPRPFNAAVRKLLREGRGVAWHDSSNGDLEHRFALLVPQGLLSAFTRLGMFTSVADDGTAIGLADLELVRDFFYLAIIGDSIQWGNGLEEDDKMSVRVTEVIEHETGRRVIRQRYAHAGARIVPAEGDAICEMNCSGEVPTASTSITAQADLIQRPDLIDLILMDGCINDLGFGMIINPLTADEELIGLTEQFCREEMATLLRKVRGLAPQAHIMVTGYFQIVGPDSDIFALRTWAMMYGFITEGGDLPLVDELVHQSVIFRDVAHESLRAAVEQVNRETGAEPLIAFADPAFGPENAVFAPEKWLWSLTSVPELIAGFDFDLALFPEDPRQDFRLERCFEPEAIDATLFCLYSSVGHPNPSGARAYADAIIRGLRDLGVLPAASTGE